MAAARHLQADGGLERVVQEAVIALRAYTTQK
jgi:propanediol dehydratase large subunit